MPQPPHQAKEPDASPGRWFELSADVEISLLALVHRREMIRRAQMQTPEVILSRFWHPVLQTNAHSTVINTRARVHVIFFKNGNYERLGRLRGRHHLRSSGRSRGRCLSSVGLR